MKQIFFSSLIIFALAGSLNAAEIRKTNQVQPFRIAFGGIFTETSSFSPIKTTIESFISAQGQKLTDKDFNDPFGFIRGFIEEAREKGLLLVPTFYSYAFPSGTIPRNVYETLKATLISALKNANNETPFDAIVLSLHGAAHVEEIGNLEADLLKAVREIFGRKIPVVVTLDLHANMIEEMVDSADAFFANHLNPHTDSMERGKDAIKLVEKMLLGTLKPTTFLLKLPLLIPTTCTDDQPARGINEKLKAYLKNPDVIEVSLIHGFPYIDTYKTGVGILVTTNNNLNLAKEIARTVADLVWDLRGEFAHNLPSPEKGIALALESDAVPIVMNEGSDNPSGGCPGDGTHLLRAMLLSKLTKTVFGTIYDPEVVQIAINSGEGAKINISLGGKLDDANKLHGKPLQVTAIVKKITDGKFIATSPMQKGAQIDFGKSVLLQIDEVYVVVVCARMQVLDPQIFIIHGINLKDFKIIGVKSSTHFRAGFKGIAAEIISVDSEGITTTNLHNLPLIERIKDPVFPLTKGFNPDKLEYVD